MSFFTQITSKAGVWIGSGSIGGIWTYVSMYITMPIIVLEPHKNVISPP